MADEKRSGGGFGKLILIGVIVLIALFIFAPQIFRTGLQVPVGVAVRPSVLGLGNVVQIQNRSEKTLTGVVVTAKNAGKNQTANRFIGTLEPGKLVEIGWMEWDWTVERNETVTVSADGFLPIVFSSEQLGIK